MESRIMASRLIKKKEFSWKIIENQRPWSSIILSPKNYVTRENKGSIPHALYVCAQIRQRGGRVESSECAPPVCVASFGGRYNGVGGRGHSWLHLCPDCVNRWVLKKDSDHCLLSYLSDRFFTPFFFTLGGQRSPWIKKHHTLWYPGGLGEIQRFF